MPEDTPAIEQVIRNYTTNLPVFPPGDADLRALHSKMVDFYMGFCAAAVAQGIAEDDQGRVLERVQKALWAFGEGGRVDRRGPIPDLTLDRLEFLSRLKFPRPEEVLTLLGRLGMPVEYQAGEIWSVFGKLKASEHIRLRSPLAPVLRTLVLQASQSSARPKVAYERFLRVNPQAIVAREKPALDLPPDASAILANLPDPAAEAWQVLVRFLEGFEGYTPAVEFRSIQHGAWTVNYNNTRGGRDLCGLILQDGTMTVRMILYRAGHLFVKGRLAEFGPLVAAAFQRARYYEEFEHQWLFVPVERVEDLVGIMKLLDQMPVLLKEK